MKKITLLITAIFSLTLVNNSYSQVFWEDSFDTTTPTSGTRNAPNHTNTTDGSNTGICGSGDYFFRTNLASDSSNGMSETFFGYSGYYWRGEDLDGCFGNPDIINFTGINISGRSNLIFKGLFGAAEGYRFEAADNLIIEYSIDGGAYVKGMAFESDLIIGVNGNLRKDINLDGMGDGTLLTPALAQYEFSIVGTGTTLSLRLTANSNSSGEEFAFDTFTVEESSTLGIDDVELTTEIGIYPNSSNDYIRIQGLKKAINYELYNLTGQKILKGTISNNEKIDVQNLIKGIYLLKLMRGNTFKFIKK